MLYKRGNECLITTMPSDLYPVDGALKAKEIVDVLEEEDFVTPFAQILARLKDVRTSLETIISKGTTASFLHQNNQKSKYSRHIPIRFSHIICKF